MMYSWRIWDSVWICGLWALSLGIGSSTSTQRGMCSVLCVRNWRSDEQKMGPGTFADLIKKIRNLTIFMLRLLQILTVGNSIKSRVYGSSLSNSDAYRFPEKGRNNLAVLVACVWIQKSFTHAIFSNSPFLSPTANCYIPVSYTHLTLPTTILV